MDRTINRRLPGIKFPVNLNGDSDEGDDNDVYARQEIRREVDFFNLHIRQQQGEEEDDPDSRRGSPDGFRDDSVAPSRIKFNVNTRLNLLTGNTSSESMVDDDISAYSEDRRAKNESAILQLQAELERMKMENNRLQEMLDQLTSNYNSLREMHYIMLMQQQQQQQQGQKLESMVAGENDDNASPRQFLELGPVTAAADDDNSPPPCSSSDGRGERSRSRSRLKIRNAETYDRDSPEENVSSRGWGPNKSPRMNSNTATSSKRSDHQAVEATMRKTRVSVRARSEAPTIPDGCQWRKYGQKMAKGNPCPRAYYRCTMANGCPVRKQVQRCAEDRTILITTYEGNHNHPLPPAAMTMASTTSSAAQMLLSGSMPSADGIMPNNNFFSTTFLPCSSNMATISASAPFPTITLDLTQNPNSLQHLQNPPQPIQFQLPFPNPTANFGTNVMPLNFPQIYNQSAFSGLQMSHDMTSPVAVGHQLPTQPLQASLADTVTALTSDPNFTNVLAAAISSIIGNAATPNSSGNTSSAAGANVPGNDNNGIDNN